MGEYSNWNELVTAAQSLCKEILKTDVAPVAENILHNHIQSDIYDAYTPKTNGWISTNGSITYYDTYNRRGSLLKNIQSHVTGGSGKESLLSVTSTAKPMPSIRGQAFYSTHRGFFLEMLENLGTSNARAHSLWRGEFPRPAVTLAQTEINKSASIFNAIQNGIDREFS